MVSQMHVEARSSCEGFCFVLFFGGCCFVEGSPLSWRLTVGGIELDSVEGEVIQWLHPCWAPAVPVTKSVVVPGPCVQW